MIPMTASEWRLGDWPDPRSGDPEPVRIVERPGYTDHDLGRLPIVVRYAVVRAGWMATRDHEWMLEPLPSSRDDAFYAATRFDEWEDAAAHAQRMATTYRESWNRRGSAAPPSSDGPSDDPARETAPLHGKEPRSGESRKGPS